jgi:hypothetical protein
MSEDDTVIRTRCAGDVKSVCRRCDRSFLRGACDVGTGKSAAIKDISPVRCISVNPEAHSELSRDRIVGILDDNAVAVLCPSEEILFSVLGKHSALEVTGIALIGTQNYINAVVSEEVAVLTFCGKAEINCAGDGLISAIRSSDRARVRVCCLSRYGILNVTKAELNLVGHFRLPPKIIGY